jgi:hypothetical protein
MDEDRASAAAAAQLTLESRPPADGRDYRAPEMSSVALASTPSYHVTTEENSHVELPFL